MRVGMPHYALENYRLSDHSRREMARRNITEAEVYAVLRSPEQAETIRDGRVVLQSRMTTGIPATTFLLRVLVDVDRDPPQVVTVYRTSKVRKYWRTEDESHI